jgi:pimeloyl-ACP methyl ester carboxylesterase
MATFGLVHGSWQASWVWTAVSFELEKLGHRAVAADMPCEDPDAGADEYAAVMVEALSSEDDDVILVGHSLGGLSIPVVASRRPVRTMVFLAAGVPRIGMSYAEQLRQEGIRRQEVFDRVLLDEHGCTILPPEVAIGALYTDCEPGVARWAAGLLRYQGQRPMTEVTPLLEWPDSTSEYIACHGDLVLDADWQCRTARERLCVEPIEFGGDHSPMLSAPTVLAEILDGIATTADPDGSSLVGRKLGRPGGGSTGRG